MKFALIILFYIWLPFYQLIASAKNNGKVKHIAVGVYTKTPPKIDGYVDSVWLQTHNQRGFVQRTPYQGYKASNDTRFYVLYDDHNIYFLFFMLDSHPEKIPARLVERDYQFYPDDSINFYLDTYNDHRRAFYFSTNPYGVEQDGLISENGSNVDMSWDGIFKVEARRNKFGWVAEFAIPFKTLRFDDSKKFQIWGFNVWRVRKEDREVTYWSLVDQNYDVFRLDKGGVLILKGIRSGNHVDFLPYLTAKHKGSTMQLNNVQSTFGLDTRYGVTSDITLNLTVNPDFGQVEIDEEQINLDKRFELSLPEKRPFFLENTNLFQLPIQTFYSRRIGAGGNIQSGVKLTGKTGPYSLGFIGVKTGEWDNFGVGDPDRPPADEWFGIFRMQRDVFTNSNIGFMLAGVERNPGGKDYSFNRSASVDWNVYLGRFQSFWGQVVGSSNYGQRNNGYAANVGLSHFDQLFLVYLNGYFYDKEFDVNGTGFFPKLVDRGHRELRFYTEMHPFINRKYLRSWGISSLQFISRDTEEFHNGLAIQNAAWVEAPDQSRLRLIMTNFREEEADILGRYPNLLYNGRDFRLSLSTDRGKPVAVQINADIGTQYYFQTHTKGKSWGGNATLLLKPISNGFLEAGFQVREFLDDDGRLMPKTKIGQNQVRLWTLRGRYLWTKNLFSRGFVQFTNGAEDISFIINSNNQLELAYQVFDRLSANILLGWRFRPGSTAYLVYTEEWDRFAGKTLTSSNRTLFFKFSYLLSF